MFEYISYLNNIYDQIESEKNKLKQILEHIPEGIILFDDQGNLIELNSSIREIFSSIYHDDLNFILQGKSKDYYFKNNILLKSIKELMNEHEENKSIQPKPGIFLKILKVEFDNAFIFIFYDISNEVKIEQFRNQIISMVSHELRTPITSISQSLYNFITYENRLQDYEKKRTIQIAYDNSKLLGEIVDDLLVVSQIDNKKLSLHYSSVDLTFVLEEIINQFENKLKSKHLSINFIPTNYSFITGDIKRITQEFRILIDNSIKYSAYDSQIDINVQKYEMDKKGINVVIKDYGIGISNEELPFLFNRFFRAKNASNIKGTGLGLSIAKELIELHQGKIGVTSKINEGTSFQVFLPY